MKSIWRPPLFILMVLAHFMRTHSLVPVFYPAVSETTALVFDGGTGALLPVQGAFSAFLCTVDASSEEASFPVEACSQDVVVYTQRRELDLMFSVVDELGFPTALTPEPEYQVNDSLARIRVLPDSLVDGSRQITNEISTITITLLEEEMRVEFMAAWSGFARNLTVLYDNEAPSVNFRSIRRRRTSAVFELDFGESVVVTQNVTCNADLPSLGSTSSVLDVLASSQSCGTDLTARDLRTVVNVTGADTWTLVQDLAGGRAVVTAFVVDGKNTSVTVTIPTAAIMDYSGNRIGGGLGEFMNGTAGGNRTFTLGFTFLPPRSDNNDTAADAIGMAATAAVVTTVAASAVTTVTTSMTTPVIGGAASGGAGGALGSGLEMLNMGQKVYFTSLVASSHLPENYKVMASNLKWATFNTELPWDSGDSEEEGRGENARKLLQTITTDGLQAAPQNPLDRIEDVEEFFFTRDPHETARRIFFWVAVLFGGLVSAHLIVLLLLHRAQKTVPKVFVFPRLELYAGEWAIPAIAAASGSLMAGDTGDAILGAAIFVLIPGLYLCWYAYMLWRHFYKPEPHDRGANLVVRAKHKGAPPDGGSSHASSPSAATTSKSLASVTGGGSSIAILPAAHPSSSNASGMLDAQRIAPATGSDETSSSERLQLESVKGEDSFAPGATEPAQPVVVGAGSKRRMWRKYVVKPTLGPKQESVAWVSTHSSHAQFVERYGPMFEDYRGHVVAQRGDLTGSSGVAGGAAGSKGALNPLPQKPWFMLRSVKRRGPAATVPFYKHYIQTAMGALLLGKLIFFAVLIHGEDEKDNLPQLVVLLVTSMAFFLLIRATQPFVRRIDMAVALLAELADVIVFALATILFSASMQSDDQRRNIGITMIFFEALAFLALFVGKMWIVLEKAAPVWAKARRYLARMTCCGSGGPDDEAPQI